MRITDIDLCISFYSALPKFELLFPQTHQLLFRSHDLINPPPKKKFFIKNKIILLIVYRMYRVLSIIRHKLSFEDLSAFAFLKLEMRFSRNTAFKSR